MLLIVNVMKDTNSALLPMGRHIHMHDPIAVLESQEVLSGKWTL